MNRLCFFLVSLTLLASACKKEIESTKEAPPATSREMSTTTAHQVCYGNSWDYDQVFYPDWYYQPNGEIGNMEPLVYNNKVYVPDADVDVVRIFNGTSWQYLSSDVPINTAYRGFSFTIGTTGYIGNTGPNGGQFHQYNFTSNSWTRKADVPLFGRMMAATFSVGAKGYIAGGMGDAGSAYYKDVWEYNSSANIWTKKADLPVALYDMSSFVLGSKAYVVNGRKNGTSYSSSLYEYDPYSNNWSTKAAFPGVARRGTIAFVIAGKAYCGGGRNSNGPLTDYYRYDPATNTWTRVADMSLYFMEKPVYGFSINSLGYGVYHHMATDDVYTVKYTPLTCIE
jgi:N-acetylneuraminic acid mutarotase